MLDELVINNDKINFNKGENLLRKRLGIKDNIQSAEIYIDIALFIESHGQIESAKFLMDKALELRPNGPFIQEKCKGYNELINSNK